MGLCRGCGSGHTPCRRLPTSSPPFHLHPHSLQPHSSPCPLHPPSFPPSSVPPVLFPHRGLPLPGSQSRLRTLPQRDTDKCPDVRSLVVCSELSLTAGPTLTAHSLSPDLRLPLQSLDHSRVALPPFRRLFRTLQTVALKGQQRPILPIRPLFSRLCPWPLSSQPAHQTSAYFLPRCSPLPPIPLHGLLPTQVPEPGTGQGWGGSALPDLPPVSCLPPAALLLTRLPLLPALPPLPGVCPSNNLSSLGLAPHLLCPLPISLSLCSWPFSP